MRPGPTAWTARVPALHALAFVAVLLLGLALRVYDLRAGLWLDEMISGWVVADGLAEIPDRSRLANLSPVFFYILQLSTWLTSFSEPGLRLPSVIGGMVSIALVPAWLRSLGVDRWTCIACALLVAIEPSLLQASTWARPASWVIVSSLVATIAFQRIVLDPPATTRDRILFVVAHVFGFYLHYLTLWVLVWQLIYASVLWLRDRERRSSMRTLAIDSFIVGLLCLPAVGHLVQLARASGSLGYAHAGTLASELDRYLVVEILLLPLLVSYFAGFAFGQTRWLREDVLRRHLPRLQLLVFLYVAPISVFWLLSKANLVELTPYSRYCAPLPILALGLVLDAVERRAPRLIGFATALVLVVSIDGSPLRTFLAEGRFSGPNQEWKQAVAQLRSEGVPGDVVFVESGLVEQQQLGADSPDSLRHYLLMPVSGLYTLAGTGMQTRAISETWVPGDPATLDAVRGAEHVFVLAPSAHTQAARRVRDALASRGLRLTEQDAREYLGATVSALTSGSAPAADATVPAPGARAGPGRIDR